jgi:hypothetical protein
MRYRITNITNAYLTLEPPSLFKRGEVTYREYANIPDRIAYLKEKGLIEVTPVGAPEEEHPVKIHIKKETKETNVSVEVKENASGLPKEPKLRVIDLTENNEFKNFEFTIIVGTDRKNDFIRFVSSLERIKCTFNLVVSDFSKELYAQEYLDSHKISNLNDFLVITEDTRLGFASSCNKMIRYATTDWIVWLNDDCEILENWDNKIMEFIYNSDNEFKIGAIFFSDPATSYKVSIHRGLLYANFGVIHRKLGDKLNWFNDEIFFYGSDVAISARALHDFNAETVSIYGCRVIHHRIVNRKVNILGDIIKKDSEIFDKAFDKMYVTLKTKIKHTDSVFLYDKA